MSGAVTAVAAVVATKVVVDTFAPSKPAPAPQQQAAAAPAPAAPTPQPAPAPQPVLAAAQEAAPVDAASALYRTTTDNSRQAMSPQATRARRGGGASGATMLSGPRGVEGQSMALSGGSTLLGS